MTIKTPKARHKRFLERGFFPREMPSCFYSEALALHRDFLWKNFSAVPHPQPKSKDPGYFVFKAEKATINFPRFGREDRRHSYVNPVSFFLLSKVLADKYVKLRGLNRKSGLSVSPSIFDWSGRRTFIGPAFGTRDTQNASLNARFEVLAEADINGFYHSIYTHSIAWAIHGKAVAKKSPRDYTLYGNLIDLLVRNAQGSQTIGIPVGPDTSRLIAEVIGSAIDQTVRSTLRMKSGGTSPGSRAAMRFVDDYLFGCASLSHAQKVVAAVREAVNSFELELNGSKTGPKPSAPFVSGGWKDELRACLPPDVKPNASALRRYLYNVHVVARDNPTSEVINYAIKRASKVFLEAEDWGPIQDYLLSAYRETSTVLPQLVLLSILRHSERMDVSLDLLSDFANSRISVLADLQKDGEIVWLLFLCVCLGLQIQQEVCQRLLKIESGALALLVADARRLGLVAAFTDFKLWNLHLTPEGMQGPMWLYAYETTLKQLNGVATNKHVTDHPYFCHLISKGIEFYRSGSGHIDRAELLRSQRAENAQAKFVQAKLNADLGEDIDDFEMLYDESDEDVYS